MSRIADLRELARKFHAADAIHRADVSRKVDEHLAAGRTDVAPLTKEGWELAHARHEALAALEKAILAWIDEDDGKITCPACGGELDCAACRENAS